MYTVEEYWKSYGKMVADLLVSLAPKVFDGVSRFFDEGNPLQVKLTVQDRGSIDAVNKQLPSGRDVLLMVVNTTLHIMGYQATGWSYKPVGPGEVVAEFTYEKIE